MYRKLPESDGEVLGYYVTGTVTPDEIKEMHRDIDSAIDQHGRVKLLVDIRDMSAPEPMAVWEDLKLTPEYISNVEKFAVIGDRRLHELATRATGAISKGKAEYFEREQIGAAWEWLKE
jgi:hypothetical protein